jgi:hypothetical protein
VKKYGRLNAKNGGMKWQREVFIPEQYCASHAASLSKNVKTKHDVYTWKALDKRNGTKKKMLFDIFSKKSLLDPGTTQWLFDSYAWALKNFGTDIFYQDTILVTPTDEHFPDKIEDAEQMASKVFQRVKKYAGMENWCCELLAQEPDGNPVVAPTIVIKNAPRGPAGTFSVTSGDQQKIIITYNPDQIGNPVMLVATFAHELGHYLSSVAKQHPPGGEALWEPATDLLATFMGFGLFLANSAFSFSQYTDVNSQGWSTQSQGYLSQYELTYALAIFCVLKDIDTSAVEKHLKSTLVSFYKKAVKEINKNQEALAILKAINSPMKTAEKC